MIPRPRILYRYVFQEILGPFLLTLFIFTGILFLTKSLKLVELVVNKNVSPWEIAQLFLYVVPQFLEIAIPMSLLLGAVLAFGRLSADSELIVMRASGVGMRQLLKPVMAFSLMAMLLSLLLSLVVRPWANYRLGVTMFEMAQQKASSGLIAGVFNEFGNLTIYSEKVGEQGGALKNVIIADRRSADQPRNFIAHHGSIVSDERSRTVSLRLYDGSIHEGKGLNYNVTDFDVNSIVIEQADLLGDEDTKEGKKANEMLATELFRASRELDARRDALRGEQDVVSDTGGGESGEKITLRAARFAVELHRRFVLPISCFVVAILGMALGVQPSRGGRSWGTSVNVTVGILLITLYYFVLAFATALGEQATLPAWAVMWLPNIVFSVLGVYLFRRIETEEWAAVSQALGDLFTRIGTRLRIV